MISYLSVDDILWIHRKGIETHGGSHGILSLDAVRAASQQPQMTFGGQDLYPTVWAKAAALGFALIKNHAFVDGNKRVGFTSMVVFTYLNGFHLLCDAAEGEQMVLDVIQGALSRDQLATWIESHSKPLH